MEKGPILATVVAGESIETRSYDQHDILHFERHGNTLLADLLLPFGAAKHGHMMSETSPVVKSPRSFLSQ